MPAASIRDATATADRHRALTIFEGREGIRLGSRRARGGAWIAVALRARRNSLGLDETLVGRVSRRHRIAHGWPIKNITDRVLASTFALRHRWAWTSRNDYKGTWNRLGFFEHDAKIGVAGLTDEAAIAATADETIERLRATVGIEASDVILEIGAGVGRVGAALSPLCRRWIGTDVSRHMVTHMRRRLSSFDNVEAIEIGGHDLAPIASASVDVVYCTVVFMHLEEWDRFNYVAEGFRVLKPNGRMVVDNVNLCSDEGWAFFEHHRAFDPTRRKPSISKTSTPQEQEAYFRRAGFAEIGQLEPGPWVVTHGIKPA